MNNDHLNQTPSGASEISDLPAIKKNKKLSTIPREYKPPVQVADMEEEMKATVPPEILKKINAILKTIGEDGLKPEEACAIINLPFDYLKEKMEEFPIIAKMVAVRQTQYKHMLLQNLSVRARSGDDKVSQWLLETRYPDEFKPNKGGGGKPGIDMLAEAISFIQESGDIVPIVRKTATVVNFRPVGQVKDPEVNKLKEFLS